MQHLLDVATDCEKAGEEFIKYIDELITVSKSSSHLESFQSSIKVKWRHSKIEAYVSRLDKLQGSLSLATVLSLRNREIGNHHEVLEHLKSIKAGDDAQQQNADELIKALNLLHGLVEQQSGPKLDMLQKQMDSCMEDIQKIRSSVTSTREGEILRWLDYRQRTWRFEEVEEAHRTTFDWIFRKPCAKTPWHDFGAHLSGTDVYEPYFINGKAGSGKSTLMKYIVSNPQTKAELRKWAGQHKLLSPYFFSWNIGTQLQKSHIGMLRSLLHSILAQYHDLIPAVFPTLFANRIPIGGDEPPSYIELKNAFERLKFRSASFLRICIFVDGVDEFEGDHRDMSTFLCSIASSAIKVIVSSRPINACLNVFRHSPTLRLQDLTQDDMQVFIRDKLSSHPMMVELQAESPGKAAILKMEIQEKAEGVFLWVRIVTGLLLRGLEDGDDFDDLLPKLRALPSDLRDLYTRMMEKMPADYQSQASQMFQIFEWWRLHFADTELELLLLAFAIKPSSTALNLSTDVRSTQMKKQSSEKTEARIRSRCCGLLELREVSAVSVFQPPTPMVTYLHRSVAEFVTSRDVWEDMLSRTNDMKFSPGMHVASGLLSILKTSNPPLSENERLRVQLGFDFNRNDYSERVLQLVMDACRRTVDIEDSFMLEFMEALDKTMTSKTQGFEGYLIDQRSCQLSAHWSARITSSFLEPEIRNLPRHMHIWSRASINSFAAYEGSLPFLRAANRSSRLADVELLILYALGSWADRNDYLSERRETLMFLLKILNDCSELGIESPIGNNTLWEHAVVVASVLLTDPRDQSWICPSSPRFLPTVPISKLSPSYHKPKHENNCCRDTTIERLDNDTVLDLDGRECDVLFEHPNTEENSIEICVSDMQQGIDILLLFLSSTGTPRELLNKAIRMPDRPTFRPVEILRNTLQETLAQKHGVKHAWSLQPEYHFLYQLVELPKPGQ